MKTFAAILFALPLIAVCEENVDLSVVHRIKSEAFENSKVMEHAFYLTDVYGPRLTNSPSFRQAAEWAAKRLESYGLKATLESWGPFGRAWSFSRYSGSLLEPEYAPLNGFPLAWSAGTNGPVGGQPVYAPIRNEADAAKYRGQLQGKIVLVDPVRDLPAIATAPAHRYSDTELAARAVAPEPGARDAAFSYFRDGNDQPITREAYTKWRNAIRDLLISEHAALAIQTSRGDGGAVFGQGAGSRYPTDPVPVPTVVLAVEQYNRIARLAEKKLPVKVEFDIRAGILDGPTDSLNVIADIPGGSKRDELVILGAHLDSWHGGTGATDNAAGVAVVMEAARILKALNLPLARTVRVALWSAEEQGLLGSKAYVKQHFADPEVMKLSPEHAKVSGYFNVDNGTGKIRGVYLQGNDMMRPVFESWLAPFRDLGVTTVSIRNTGSTDHVSFDQVGIPGFQFIQDDIEYMTRTHHSNMDVYDRLQKGDLMQAAAVLASVVYDAANRPELLPRKPLPKPQPKKTDSGTTSQPPRPAPIS